MENIYLQNRHTLVINGIPIQGFAEGDFIGIKLDGAAAARTKGGDGPAMNISTDQGGQMKISLLPTSPALGAMYAIREEQKQNPSFFSIVLMSGVGELIAAAGCAMGEPSEAKTGGPTMQPREFLFESLKIKMDTSFTTPVAGVFI